MICSVCITNYIKVDLIAFNTASLEKKYQMRYWKGTIELSQIYQIILIIF